MIPIQPVPLPGQAQPMPKPNQPDNAGLFFQALAARQAQQRDQMMAQKALADTVMSMSSLMEKKREADMENAQGEAMLDFKNRMMAQQQQLQDFLLNAKPTVSTDANGQTMVTTPGKNGPNVKFGSGTSAGMGPQQQAALQWGIEKGLLAPAEITRGPKAMILASGLMQHPEFQKDMAAGWKPTADFNPMGADTSFAGGKAGAVALGGKGALIQASSSQILPNLADLNKLLETESQKTGYGSGVPAIDQAVLAFRDKAMGQANSGMIRQKAGLAADELQANFGQGSDKKLDLGMGLLRSGSLQQQQVGAALVSQALKYRIDAYGKPRKEWQDPDHGKIRVSTPDGKTGRIPVEQIEEALGKGFKVLP